MQHHLNEIPTILRTSRKSLRLTQAELAEAIGVSRLTINALENGKGETIAFKTVQQALSVCGHDLTVSSRLPDDSTEPISAFFRNYPEVIAVYPMPQPIKNDVTRLAVVVNPALPSIRRKLRKDLHQLELKLDRIVDTFLFEPGIAPKCEPGEALYGAIDFTSSGENYLPYNETDTVNKRKLDAIVQFADLLESDPDTLERINKRVLTSQNSFHADRRFEYEQDWLAYLNLYPIPLLLTFLRSDSSHLQEICASSPILRFSMEWR